MRTGWVERVSSGIGGITIATEGSTKRGHLPASLCRLKLPEHSICFTLRSLAVPSVFLQILKSSKLSPVTVPSHSLVFLLCNHSPPKLKPFRTRLPSSEKTPPLLPNPDGRAPHSHCTLPLPFMVLFPVSPQILPCGSI